MLTAHWVVDGSAYYHHHHLTLQPFVGFLLLSQVSPSSSILSCLLPVFDFQLFCFFHDIFLPSLSWSTGLVPIGFQSNSFLVGLAWSILWICPSHLILCALLNLTISAPSIKLSISMLLRIRHTLSILSSVYLLILKLFIPLCCLLLIVIADSRPPALPVDLLIDWLAKWLITSWLVYCFIDLQ